MAGKFADEDEDEAALYAMQLVGGVELPMVLKVAIELGLLETIVELASSPGQEYISASVIAARLPIKNPDGVTAIDRILHMLASHSIVKCDVKDLLDGGVERVYGAAPVCKYLMKNEDGVSLAPLCLLTHDKVFMECWYYLKDAVLGGGIAFNKAYGMSLFEYSSNDTRLNKVFNRAMSDTSIITMTKILVTYKGFEGIGSLVDVGGGTGGILNMITSKYPMIKGLNFDLPHVISDAPSYPYVEHVGGDMFVSVPKGDVIFMKWILHNWSDEHCLKILKNCYDAIPADGKVILVDCILPERPDTSLTTKLMVSIDLFMLAYTPGGKERTRKEFESLAKSAGFQGFRVDCSAYDTSVMELLKNTA